MYPLSKSTNNFKLALDIANQTAAELGTSFVGSEHLIYAFLCVTECEANSILSSEGVNRSEYGGLFTKKVDKNYQGQGLTPRMCKTYDRAVELAQADGLLASTAHMLYEILCMDCVGVAFLKRFADIEILKEKTLSAIQILKKKKEWGETEQEDVTLDPLTKPFTETSGEATGSLTSLLMKQEEEKSSYRKASKREAEMLAGFGVDMTEQARKGKMDPVIGRKKEIEQVVQVLSRRMNRGLVKVRLSKEFLS